MIGIGDLRFSPLPALAQVEDITLKQGQAPRPRHHPEGIDKQVVLGGEITILQHPEQLLPLLAQRGQQGIAGAQMQLIRTQFRGQAVDGLLGTDIAPILPARRKKEKVQVCMLGQGIEDLQMKRGQRGEAENREARRQSGIDKSGIGQGRQKQRPQMPPVHGAGQAIGSGDQLAPESGLPVLILSRLPGQDHLGPKEQVLVKAVGQPPGQLIALQLTAVTEITGDQGIFGPLGQFRQDPQQLPLQNPPVHHGPGEQLRQDQPENPVHEIIGKGTFQVGANPLGASQLITEPAGHAAALHHHDLRGERRQGGDTGHRDQGLGQLLQPVT